MTKAAKLTCREKKFLKESLASNPNFDFSDQPEHIQREAERLKKIYQRQEDSESKPKVEASSQFTISPRELEFQRNKARREENSRDYRPSNGGYRSRPTNNWDKERDSSEGRRGAKQFGRKTRESSY